MRRVQNLNHFFAVNALSFAYIHLLLIALSFFFSSFCCIHLMSCCRDGSLRESPSIPKSHRRFSGNAAIYVAQVCECASRACSSCARVSCARVFACACVFVYVACVYMHLCVRARTHARTRQRNPRMLNVAIMRCIKHNRHPTPPSVASLLLDKINPRWFHMPLNLRSR